MTTDEAAVEAWTDALARAKSLDALLNLPEAEARIEEAIDGTLKPDWSRHIVLELMAQGKFRLDGHSPAEAVDLANELLAALDAEFFTIETEPHARGQSYRWRCHDCGHSGQWGSRESFARRLYYGHLRSKMKRLARAS